MRTSFQTYPQQAVALEAELPQSPPATCRPAAFVRTTPVVKRAKRIHACTPQQTRVLPQARIEQLPLPVPRPGKSAIHRRMYVDNIAGLRQVLAQAEISSVIGRQSPPTDPDDGTDPVPDTPDLHPLGDIGFSVYSAIIMVANHLADTHDVDARSFLEKLEKITRPLIFKVDRLLEFHKMPKTRQAFLQAVDPKPFLALIANGHEGTDAVFDRINATGDLIIEALAWVGIEAPEGRAIDWRPTTTPPAAPTAPGPPTAPAAASVAELAESPGAAAAEPPQPRIGTKRAKKITTPRSKR